MQDIYKKKGIPTAIYNINNIIKNISKSNKTEKAFELELAQKEQDKLNKEDKDKTGKYKKIENIKFVFLKFIYKWGNIWDRKTLVCSLLFI